MFGQTFSAQSSATISTRPVIPSKRSRSDSLIVTTGDSDMDYEYDDNHANDEDDDDIEIILDPSDLDLQDQFIFEICNIITNFFSSHPIYKYNIDLYLYEIKGDSYSQPLKKMTKKKMGQYKIISRLPYSFSCVEKICFYLSHSLLFFLTHKYTNIYFDFFLCASYSQPVL
ncbi:hypothetical protein CLU79DRAFT_847668 [Phycomyces nitens]|nr:hypothetical protein CLU79DRAFT_847668 [Phycomyces nitens]